MCRQTEATICPIDVANENHSMPVGRYAAVLTVVLLLGSATLPAVVNAQESTESVDDASESALLLDDVVVTAQKREQSIQDVPVSITAFDSEQLEAAKVRDLGDLTVGIPNVSFDEIGTSRGTANFSIGREHLAPRRADPHR